MEKSVQNILEVISALKELGKIGALVSQDGKVDLSDIVHLKGLLEKQAVLAAAVKDIGEVVAEAQDLSIEESVQIVTALIAALKEVKEAA